VQGHPAKVGHRVGSFECRVDLGEEAEVSRPSDGLRSIRRPELLEDVTHVPLDRVQRDHQLIRDLLVPSPRRQQIQNLRLPSGQRLDRRWPGRARSLDPLGRERSSNAMHVELPPSEGCPATTARTGPDEALDEIRHRPPFVGEDTDMAFAAAQREGGGQEGERPLMVSS
jgi:hypothetical protein